MHEVPQIMAKPRDDIVGCVDVRENRHENEHEVDEDELAKKGREIHVPSASRYCTYASNEIVLSDIVHA